MPLDARLEAANTLKTSPIIVFVIFIRPFLVLLALFRPLEKPRGGTIQG
jgi:hypothetical protein